MMTKLKIYLILGLLICSLINVNSQELMPEKIQKPITINTDLLYIYSTNHVNSIYFGLTKSNIIKDKFDINFEYYYYKSNLPKPYYHFIDINFKYNKPFTFRKNKSLYLIGGYLLRNTYLRGYPGTNIGDIYSCQKKTIYKLGIGISTGVGINVSNNLFVESNLKFGIYVLGKNDQFHGDLLSGIYDQDPKAFFTFHLLNIGYRFGNYQKRKYIIKNQISAFGISINPFRFLYPIIVSNASIPKTFSGSINYFNYKKRFEIEMPIYLKNYEYALLLDDDYEKEEGIKKTKHIGISFKKYNYGFKTGIYFNGFVRYCILEGLLEKDDPHNYEPYKHIEHKIAIGFGVGLNYFLNDKWFINFYLQQGKYIFGENNVFPLINYEDKNDMDSFFEFGSLKIGYKFKL